MNAKRNNHLKVVDVEVLDEPERQELQSWTERAIALREDKSLTTVQKVKALKDLKLSPKLMKILATAIIKFGKDGLWNKRGWASRLALLGAAGGLALAPGSNAGLAMLGGAVGIPVFLVTAAGGALLGAILSDITSKKT